MKSRSNMFVLLSSVVGIVVVSLLLYNKVSADSDHSPMPARPDTQSKPTIAANARVPSDVVSAVKVTETEREGDLLVDEIQLSRKQQAMVDEAFSHVINLDTRKAEIAEYGQHHVHSPSLSAMARSLAPVMVDAKRDRAFAKVAATYLRECTLQVDDESVATMRALCLSNLRDLAKKYGEEFSEIYLETYDSAEDYTQSMVKRGL